MKKYRTISLVVLLSTLISCASWKEMQESDGDEFIAVKNAILDLRNTESKFYESDDVYSVRIKRDGNDIIGLSFYGALNKFIVIDDESIESPTLPNRYYEVDDKLFYWNEGSGKTSNELIEKLIEYNQLDTLKSVGDDISVLDHLKPSFHFYFCSKNLLVYKKVKTNKALGRYDPPSLDCN